MKAARSKPAAIAAHSRKGLDREDLRAIVYDEVVRVLVRHRSDEIGTRLEAQGVAQRVVTRADDKV